MEILCNTRCLASPLTGVQRYTEELLALSRDQIAPCAPGRPLGAVRGHAWEQGILPRLTRGAMLWSPANTGPLAVSRQVVTMHDMAALEHPEWVSRKFAAWYQFLLPRLARRVLHILTISRFSKERILACTGVPEQKVSVIPNGVDPRFTPAAEQAQAELRHRLGLGQRRYVLSLGSLEPRKNIATLLDAWRRLADRLPADVWLVLAGAKGNSRIFRGVNGLDRLPPRVLLAGHVPEQLLPALYTSAECFVYPSLYEGFGMPPLEAMACGTPVVASRSGALPEVVGTAGLLIDPSDPAQICDAVTALHDDSQLRAHLAREGRMQASRFRWADCATATLRTLRQFSEQP